MSEESSSFFWELRRRKIKANAIARRPTDIKGECQYFSIIISLNDPLFWKYIKIPLAMLARPNGKKKILEPSVNSNPIKIKPSMLHRVGLKIYSIIKSFVLLKSRKNCFQAAQ